MFSKLALVVGAAAVLATGSAWADGFTLKVRPKIAFLYFKAKNDGGWTQAFEEARPKMEKALGMQIPYVENIAEDAAQITPPAEKFIQRGYNIIIGTAFGYSDTFKELAAKHPDVAFLNAAGTTNGPNLQSFYGRTYESQYLVRHGRRRRIEVRQARFRRRQSVRHRQLDGQRLRTRRAEAQSQGDFDGGLSPAPGTIRSRSAPPPKRWPTKAST